MRQSYIRGLCSLAICAILAVPLAITSAVERAVAFVFELFPALASAPAFAVDGPALAFDAPGDQLDPALQNSMRHEAGMRRLR